jgi:hypothetical protein
MCTKRNSKFGNAFKQFEQAESVPTLFSSTIKDTNKLGTRKIAPKKKYIKPDIEIGNKIVGKDADLEGFGDVITRVKKEDVAVPAGAIRKHKMVKQLSGRFTKDQLKSEAMEMHAKRLEEVRKNNLDKENGENGQTGDGRETLKATARAYTSSMRTDFTRVTLGKKKRPGDKEKRKKVDIFALVDDAIENEPTEEAKAIAAAKKAFADAPILPELPRKKCLVAGRKSVTPPPGKKEPKTKEAPVGEEEPLVEDTAKEIEEEKTKTKSAIISERLTVR